ncbi:PREDICTED: uncharacterized protein LOC104991881, partial [Bison bison bison]|uniref:Ciliogenesis and planar polarity effector 2 n=1 Tax=Bison bison bison TaxID=43346 RepID=A0A6P3HJ57_BISBB
GRISLVGWRLLGQEFSRQGLCLPHQTEDFLPGPLLPSAAASPVPRDPPGPPGIQTTVVFWPAKLQASDRVVMFRFEFWDCGESALKKFEHMLPACKENADAFLFLFSFTDRASFEDLPGQLARVAGEAPGVVRMVIGSKFDQYVHTDVPERDLAAFRPRGWDSGGKVKRCSLCGGDISGEGQQAEETQKGPRRHFTFSRDGDSSEDKDPGDPERCTSPAAFVPDSSGSFLSRTGWSKSVRLGPGRTLTRFPRAVGVAK